MNKNMTSAMAGVAFGMIAGTAAYMMSGRPMHSQGKKFKKTAGRAIRNAGVIIDSVSEMMR